MSFRRRTCLERRQSPDAQALARLFTRIQACGAPREELGRGLEAVSSISRFRLTTIVHQDRHDFVKQLAFLRKERLAYGGELLKTREGRRRGRPLDTRNTMHLILKSSHARGDWSFRRSANREKIRALIQRFSARYGVRVLSLANVGNHLHFQIRLTNRFTYPAFIRALTGAIAMAVTGSSRWKPLEKDGTPIRFWDYRPFTRVVQGLRGHLGLRDYIRINQFEGCGYRRVEARWLIARDRMKSRKAPDARAGPGPR